MRRERTLRPVEEILSAVTHGLGFFAGIVGLIFLIYFSVQTHEPYRVVGTTIFGSSIILLYLFSSLYHSFIFTRSRKIFQIFDHSAIFILIAGTYTPILLNFRSTFGLTLFIVLWAVAAVGIVMESVFRSKIKKLSLLLYFITGWIIVLAWNPLLETVNYRMVYWILGGGILYTFGAVFYIFQYKRYFHVIWHFFVLGGTLLHYLGILFYIAIR